MILHFWLQLRDAERAAHPWLPKRDRDVWALRLLCYESAEITTALARMIEREARKA